MTPNGYLIELGQREKKIINIQKPPFPEMEEVVSFCGTVSGRNYDKFKETTIEFTLVKFWQPIKGLVRPAENLELEEEDE